MLPPDKVGYRKLRLSLESVPFFKHLGSAKVDDRLGTSIRNDKSACR